MRRLGWLRDACDGCRRASAAVVPLARRPRVASPPSEGTGRPDSGPHPLQSAACQRLTLQHRRSTFGMRVASAVARPGPRSVLLRKSVRGSRSGVRARCSSTRVKYARHNPAD